MSSFYETDFDKWKKNQPFLGLSMMSPERQFEQYQTVEKHREKRFKSIQKGLNYEQFKARSNVDKWQGADGHPSGQAKEAWRKKQYDDYLRAHGQSEPAKTAPATPPPKPKPTPPPVKVSLPKMADDPKYQEMLAAKKKIADEGISQEERESFRSKMAQQMSQAEQMAGLRMGGAMGGAQGAGVAAQQRGLVSAGLQSRAGIERDIFLAQEKAKREGLQEYGKTLEEGMKFDIGTKAQEKAMQFQKTALSQSLASAEKQAEIQSSLARQQGKSKGLLGLGVLGF